MDFIDKFDIDVCMNYFDGEKVFIKYPESIKSNTAVFTTSEYNVSINSRQLGRIIKYNMRAFDVKIHFINSNKVYDTLILYSTEQAQIVNSECKNLFVILRDNQNKFKLTNGLPLLEELIITNFSFNYYIDNLPITLKILKIYDSQYGLKKKSEDNYNKYIKIYSSLKIPFGCSFFVNNKLFV